MRVLQINAVSGYSSTGRICVEIAEYLNNTGHEGYIAYADGFSFKRSYKIGNKIDHKIHALFSRLFGLQAYFSVYSTRKLLKYIEKLNPDVVHLHNLHSNYINLKSLLCFLADNDIPTVISLHDCWFYTGKCTHYTVDSCYRWKENCGNCPRLNKDNPSWFFDRTAKLLRDKNKWFSQIPRLVVVGVSDWITNEAKKSILSSARTITRIYNWIDLDVFKPVDATELKLKLNLEGKFIILGVASGWSNAKGLDKFLELVTILTDDMRIVLVGNINRNISLPKNIIHLPSTHNVSELVQYYSMADVYLHLSPEETFGKTIAEALSCGTPAIVMNSTACPEVVDGNCGIILDNNQTDKILEAISKIKVKGQKTYSLDAISRVKEHFNLESNIEKFVSLYKELIDYVD